jgi:hypothetical protein
MNRNRIGRLSTLGDLGLFRPQGLEGAYRKTSGPWIDSAKISIAISNQVFTAKLS